LPQIKEIQADAMCYPGLGSDLEKIVGRTIGEIQVRSVE
jgi:hypothetical protein